MKRFYFLMLLIILLWDIGSFAEVLTLNDCVARGLDNNRELKIAYENFRKFKGTKQKTRALYFPHVSLTAMYNRVNFTASDRLKEDFEKFSMIPGQLSQLFLSTIQDPTMQAVYAQKIQGMMSELNLPSELPKHVGMLNTGVFVSQPIFTGFRILNANRAISAAEKGAYYQYIETKNKVILDIETTFYQALLMDHLVEVYQMAVKIGNDHLDIIKKMHAEGLASDWDLLKARTHIQKLEPQLADAKRKRELVYSKLRLLIGASQEDELLISGDFKAPEIEYAEDFDSLYKIAKANNPLLKSVSLFENSSKYLLKTAYGSLLPQIGGFANYTFLGINDEYNVGSKDINKVFAVGISLKWDIFTGGEHFGKIKEKRAELESVKQKKSQVMDYVKIQIKDALNQLKYAKENYKTHELNVQLSEKSLQIAEESFKNGTAREVDVLDAQLDLKSAKVSYYQMIYDYITADLNLKKALGVISKDFNHEEE